MSAASFSPLSGIQNTADAIQETSELKQNGNVDCCIRLDIPCLQSYDTQRILRWTDNITETRKNCFHIASVSLVHVVDVCFNLIGSI